MTETGQSGMPASRMSAVNLIYPLIGRDTAKSGMGRSRRLSRLAESIFVNVGGRYRDAKASSPPMPGSGVGATIVLRARASRAHGEGLQPAGTSGTEVTGGRRDEVPVKAGEMLRRLSDEFDRRGESPLQ